VNYKHKEEKNG